APAASKARAPLCITPQMSTIHASNREPRSAIEERIGIEAGFMPPHLEQIGSERKSLLCGDGDDGVLVSAGAHLARLEQFVPGDPQERLLVDLPCIGLEHDALTRPPGPGIHPRVEALGEFASV